MNLIKHPFLGVKLLELSREFQSPTSLPCFRLSCRSTFAPSKEDRHLSFSYASLLCFNDLFLHLFNFSCPISQRGSFSLFRSLCFSSPSPLPPRSFPYLTFPLHSLQFLFFFSPPPPPPPTRPTLELIGDFFRNWNTCISKLTTYYFIAVLYSFPFPFPHSSLTFLWIFSDEWFLRFDW